jgi:hypothetical protein
LVSSFKPPATYNVVRQQDTNWDAAGCWAFCGVRRSFSFFFERLAGSSHGFYRVATQAKPVSQGFLAFLRLILVSFSTSDSPYRISFAHVQESI